MLSLEIWWRRKRAHERKLLSSTTKAEPEVRRKKRRDEKEGKNPIIRQKQSIWRTNSSELNCNDDVVDDDDKF